MNTKRIRKILFVYTKFHAEVGYRQGMHEVLAIIFWCTDLDSLDDEAGLPSAAHSHDLLASIVLSRHYVEHDSYGLFSVLMTNMLSWYDPALSVSLNGQSPSLVQPVVAKCARIQELLKKVDLDLWRRMEDLQIEPQIYGIRWIRLLFSREFPMTDVYAKNQFCSQRGTY